MLPSHLKHLHLSEDFDSLKEIINLASLRVALESLHINGILADSYNDLQLEQKVVEGFPTLKELRFNVDFVTSGIIDLGKTIQSLRPDIKVLIKEQDVNTVKRDLTYDEKAYLKKSYGQVFIDWIKSLF